MCVVLISGSYVKSRISLEVFIDEYKYGLGHNLHKPGPRWR
jgi:hypothetical protein